MSYRALASILKYDQVIPESRGASDKIKKGYYQSEEPLVAAIKEKVLTGRETNRPFKTVECQIMDISDDIAYSTYDLDDALKSGLISILDLLTLNDDELQVLADKVNTAIGEKIDREVGMKDVFKSIIEILDSQNILDPILKEDGLDIEFDRNDIEGVAIRVGLILKSASDVGTSAYFRNTLTSHLVGEFIRAVKIKQTENNDLTFAEVYLDPDVWIKVEVLKHMTFHFLIHSPRWKVVARRSHEIVNYLFTCLSTNDGYELLPTDWQLVHKEAPTRIEKLRVICDFIACMTDDYAIEYCSRLRSDKPSSFFKPI